MGFYVFEGEHIIRCDPENGLVKDVTNPGALPGDDERKIEATPAKTVPELGVDQLQSIAFAAALALEQCNVRRSDA